MIIPKTEQTLQLERDIFSATKKKGIFGCFEVTIGFNGNERVDYITYSTQGIWRCYEIKISKSDFHSKAHNTFIGHFNYYVMPKELYEEVKNEIPKHIGVYIRDSLIRNPKKQELKVDEQILKDSLIRSLCREADKVFKSGNPAEIDKLNRKINGLKTESKNYKNKYLDLLHEVQERYGKRWNKDVK